MLLALLSLAACGALPPVTEKPTVTVNTLSIRSASFTGVDGLMTMDVFNPNGYSLPLRRVEWKLAVGDAQAVDGVFDLSKTIPAKNSAPIKGRLELKASSAMSVARVLAGGAKTYTIQGRMHFQTRFGDLAVDFSHEGSVAAEVASIY